MGQWGAQGYAAHGSTYQQILADYYPGTTLETAPASKIRVLLAQGRKTLSISSDETIAVVGSDGVQHTLAAGTTKLTPKLALAVDGGSAKPLTPPLTFTPASGSSLTLGHPYHGTITVDVVNGRLQAVDTLPLEQYVADVVPVEMPSTWQPAALEAQAVASRSYALATRHVGASFDVYADTRSQAYGGIDAETPAATAAVAATAGEVLYTATRSRPPSSPRAPAGGRSRRRTRGARASRTCRPAPTPTTRSRPTTTGARCRSRHRRSRKRSA